MGDPNWHHAVTIEGSTRIASVRLHLLVNQLNQLLKVRLGDAEAELTQSTIGLLQGQVFALSDSTNRQGYHVSSRRSHWAVLRLPGAHADEPWVACGVSLHGAAQTRRQPGAGSAFLGRVDQVRSRGWMGRQQQAHGGLLQAGVSALHCE